MHSARGEVGRKRGRPPKFGRPSEVVALTLPEEVVSGLRRLHPDLAWAVVTLVEDKLARRAGRMNAQQMQAYGTALNDYVDAALQGTTPW